MSSKKKLILIPSERMDANKKESRNENGLIRMSARARKYMDFTDDQVEVWATGGNTDEGKKSSVLLDIFQAFSADAAMLKKLINKGELKPTDVERIGFVTSKMYARVTGAASDSSKNVWISAGVHDTVMGCDPEFLLFNGSGGVIKANGVSGFSKNGKLGWDGPMAEVRPDPATTPDGLVANIEKCFRDEDLTYPIRDYDWKVGCYHRDDSRDYPMGGHIHVGNPIKVTRITMPKRELFFNVLNKVMDELLAIPCIRLDGEAGHKRRTGCLWAASGGGFGWFGEWRPHNGRLEHRTLSGMWMLNPSIAKCVIGTAKAITDEAFKRWSHEKFTHDYIIPSKYSDCNKSHMNADGFNGWKDFPICQDLGAEMPSKELRMKLNASKGSDITTKYVNDWHKKMKRLTTYGQYSKYIDGLAAILKISMNELHGWDRRIQTNWLNKKKFLVNV